MGITTCLLLAAFAALPDVEASTVQGKTGKGAFQQLTAETLTVKTAAGTEVGIPVSELLEVKFSKPTPVKVDLKTVITVTLVDGTELTCTKVSTTTSAAKLQSPLFGQLKLPLTSLFSIRFKPFTPQLAQKWKELQKKETRKDLLVVPRTNTLDYVRVVVERFTDEKVHFALAGKENDLDRKKLFGIIFSRPKQQGDKPFCNVRLAGSGGGSLQVSRIRWNGSVMKARLLAGVNVEIPVAHVAMLDFSLGKIQYLSDMVPRDVEFTPFFDDKETRSLFRYRNDKTYMSRKLKLGKTTYDRGLWIYSRTRLTYRINGEYRRFRAVMGIDHFVAQRGLGFVHVVISGDGKKLFEGNVRGTDKPRVLDLDVSKVRNLEIFVDYGDDNSTADHLDLCNARVIK